MYDHLGTWTRELSGKASARLDLWDTGRTDSYGKSELRYALWICDDPVDTDAPSVIIEGEDFHPSPLHAIDSDASAAALISFMAYYGDTSEEDIPVTPKQKEMLYRYSDELFMWEYDLDGEESC